MRVAIDKLVDGSLKGLQSLACLFVAGQCGDAAFSRIDGFLQGILTGGVVAVGHNELRILNDRGKRLGEDRAVFVLGIGTSKGKECHSHAK